MSLCYHVKMKKIVIPILFGIILAGCQFSPLSQTEVPKNSYKITQTNTTVITTTPSATPTPEKLAENITATFKTSLGDITIELFPKSAPKTVANFVALAKGTKDWTDPKTNKLVTGKSLYAGTIFHRVIPDFMIQGGDPAGTGMGGPGYRFEDEFTGSENFSEPYMLAMANAGPNTNGSQFFITVAPTTWLNGKHTIFGKVTKGQDVVDKISTVKTLPGDKPTTPITLNSIEIIEK